MVLCLMTQLASRRYCQFFRMRMGFRLNSVDALLVGMFHEIRFAVRIISTHTELIRITLGLYRMFVNVIVDCCTRCMESKVIQPMSTWKKSTQRVVSFLQSANS